MNDREPLADRRTSGGALQSTLRTYARFAGAVRVCPGGADRLDASTASFFRSAKRYFYLLSVAFLYDSEAF